uniref:Uncharacterized protein n=1 Tax=Tetradesmus obliquus TaxID=3088 RepID=A0A383VFN5_TETOB|eukprot:jgi/Sobl393_1/9948/SZX63552.1
MLQVTYVRLYTNSCSQAPLPCQGTQHNHCTTTSSSSSCCSQTVKQPGTAAASNVQCSLKRCSQLAWYDLALGSPEHAADAYVIVSDTWLVSNKQQQQQQQQDGAGCQACPSSTEALSNEELRSLLLSLELKETAASHRSSSSSMQFGSSSTKPSEFGGAWGPLVLQQMDSMPAAVAAAMAVPSEANVIEAAAGSLVLLDWGPAEW